MTSVVNTKITKFMSFFSFSGEGEIIRLTHYICKQKKKKKGRNNFELREKCNKRNEGM